MVRLPKILILYAKFGEGHYQAAAELLRSFERQGVAEARMIDLLAESHPVLNEVSRFVYRKSYTLWPRVYGWVYEATKQLKSESPFYQWLHRFGSAAIQRVVEREQPDAVVHTFPVLALPAIANRLPFRVPMFNVVTDFDLHMRWVHPGIDKYYVPTDDMAKRLIAQTIAPQRVAAVGMPIRAAFGSERVHPSAAYRYGLDPHRPIVLVMACGNGAGAGVRQTIRKLGADGRTQVAVVCGRDRLLHQDLQVYFRGQPHVSVLGFVERIDELMGLSSCIVTKPGGLTLSEAIHLSLPLVLYRPVPGQERNNALYLQEKNAAAICSTPEQLYDTISALLQDDSRRSAMAAAARLLRKENAANVIGLDIVSQLHIMESVASETPVPVLT